MGRPSLRWPDNTQRRFHCKRDLQETGRRRPGLPLRLSGALAAARAVLIKAAMTTVPATPPATPVPISPATPEDLFRRLDALRLAVRTPEPAPVFTGEEAKHPPRLLPGRP